MSKTANTGLTNSQPVAETFEEELTSIKEKGKNLKGEQWKFYTSIVQRVENNCQALNDLRKEHSSLREKLTELVNKKQEYSTGADLDLDLSIKHTNHEVNLLKKQIDKLKHQKETSLKRQQELEVILANFKQAALNEHPEEQRIRDMKNRLDKANIKNQETNHLTKIYNSIIHLLDRQKMHWTPILQEKQAQITQKQKDIADLTLIARDSKHSKMAASNEYKRTSAQIAQSQAKREAQLEKKKTLLKSINYKQQMDNDNDNKTAAKPQQSLNSQPSVLRNKMNKAAREKREERFRSVSAIFDEIREHFGTNEPDKIEEFFKERREHSETLQKQIEDLKAACEILEKKSNQMKAALEEAEYASSKGVGGNRLLSEGERILNEKRDKLKTEQRLKQASETHHKNVLAGITHLQEVISLIQTEDEEAPTEGPVLLRWIAEKSNNAKNQLDEEDVDFIAITNKNVLQNYVSRTETGFDLQQVDSNNRVQRRMLNPSKTQTNAKHLENTTRVLDRNQVKQMAAKTFQQTMRQKRQGNNPA